jgi:hypothetical protein
MAKLASGKKSVAISDRSGFKVKYTDLKTTWDGLRVEPSEWEPKHPQLTPAKNVVDATALFQPRVDNDPENVDIFLGFTQDIFASRVQRSQNGVGIKGLGSIGFVGISLNEPVTGLAGTANIGAFAYGFEVTGVSATGAAGTAVAEDQADVNETGTSGTGAVGDVALGVNTTGTTSTGAIGTNTLNYDYVFDQTGVSGTGTTGDESFDTQTGALTGQVGTGALGSVDNNASIDVTGVVATSAIGTFGEEGDGTLNLTVQGVGVLGDIGTGTEEAESQVIEANDTGFGEQYWGYGQYGGDPEIVGTGVVGTATTDIFNGPNPQTGVSGTGALGSIIVQGNIDVTGTAGTGAIGTESLETDVNPSGLAGTATLGVSQASFVVDITSVTGTTAIGTFGLEIETNETGLAGAGGIGNVGINPGWGQGSWNDDTWGN